MTMNKKAWFGGLIIIGILLVWAAEGQAQPVTFNPATNFAAGSAPISVALGDFNGDGKADLAVANDGSNDVSILLGNGLGGFRVATNFEVAWPPNSVAVADFNGDGKADLATANWGSNNVSILLGNGSGRFAAATNFAVGTNPFSVAVGDFNGVDCALESALLITLPPGAYTPIVSGVGGGTGVGIVEVFEVA